MFRSWAILGFAMNHLSQWFSDPLITKRLTCSHLLTKGTLSELVRKSEQIFLVYKNQKIWVYRAESKSQGTNYWICNHKYNKAFLKKKKRKRKKIKVCMWYTWRYMILFCTRSDSSLASFSLQSPAPSAWLRWYRSVMMDLKIT